jgi:hypothetical protein
MSQIRNKTGVKFEKEVCKLYGWQLKTVSPKIKWSGTGKNNFEKIKNYNFNSNLFNPLQGSVLEKYDAINNFGQKVEIKKYITENIKGKWKLYSEPFFKISTKSQVKSISKYFGDGDVDLARNKYNDFLVDFRNKETNNDILKSISDSNIGIQFVDKLVLKKDIDFKIEVNKGWNGFNRLTIFFKIN